ncbi:DUF2391 family protein [Halorarum salinum]|uniref:DUF2391 family protein n=1 Tax=Halorarum salinum TaxID=2743089 RepID=A0A7D5QIS5_9EURY|nr:DUF2391 family protein [Halobaculum salinum]QLG63622.1 DUF2391 family protein [Halobaculum salinum]
MDGGLDDGSAGPGRAPSDPAAPEGGESTLDPGGGTTDGGEDASEEPTVEDLLDQLETLEETVDEPEEVREVRAAMRTATRLSRPTVFGRVVRGFDRSDLAEALLGSVIFGAPMLVEGGTQEVGTYLAANPAYMVGTAAFTVAVVVGIIYVADFQDVRVDEPILGVVPRRLVGVLGVATLTATVGLTVWGRITWADPAFALGNVLAVLVPMSVGAALGDLLPG